jgi:hypothetical protein
MVKMPFLAISSSILPTEARGAPTEEDAKNCCGSYINVFQTSFSDANVQTHYEQFRIQSVTCGMLWLWFCVVLLLNSSSSFGLYLLYTKYKETLFIVNIVLTGRIILACMAFYVCYRVTRCVPTDASMTDLRKQTSIITNLTNAIIIGLPLVNGLMLCYKATRGGCEDFDERYGFYDCNEAYDTGGVPSAGALYLMMFNIFIITTLRCHHCKSDSRAYSIAANNIVCV